MTAPYYYAIKDLSHAPKLAAALGNMVVAWAHAENMLFCALSRITGIGLNMALAGYYRIPTFEARVKFILSLIPDWKTDTYDKEQITAAITKLSKLASARNHWIHGDWCADKPKTTTIIFNHRASLESPERKKPVKEADVLNHNVAVIARTGTLGKLIDYKSLEA